MKGFAGLVGACHAVHIEGGIPCRIRHKDILIPPFPLPARFRLPHGFTERKTKTLQGMEKPP
jgi:hypothetical protein